MPDTDALPPRTVTRAIHRLRAGDPTAEQDLWAMLYDRLRARAATLLHGDGLATTLHPTEVVHRVYARLEPRAFGACRDREHALRLVTRVMRRVLVDEARRCRRRRRADRWLRERFATLSAGAPLDLDDRLDIALAIETLAGVDAFQAEVVSLRHYAGLSCPEIAELLGRRPRTVQLAWARGRAWLRGWLDRGNGGLAG